MFTISENYIISFDISEKEAILTVGKFDGLKPEVINTIKGGPAIVLYELLVNKDRLDLKEKYENRKVEK